MRNLLHAMFRWFFPHKPSAEVLRKYRIPANLNLHIQLTPDGWFCASVPELPGLVTQARSQQELVVMINDAVLTYFDVPRREADIIYDKITVGSKVIQYEGKMQARTV